MPLLNAQIRGSVARMAEEDPESALYSIVLCHSMHRCSDLAEYVTSLLEFSQGTVDVVNLAFGDFNETLTSLKL
jgi:hypothetical protein